MEDNEQLGINTLQVANVVYNFIKYCKEAEVDPLDGEEVLVIYRWLQTQIPKEVS